MKTLIIRDAVPDDAEALLRIYTPYVEKTAITFEYNVPTPEEFRNRILGTTAKYPYLIAENEEGILGYAYTGPFKTRDAYQWSVETSIYLAMDKRGLGVGSQLYSSLEAASRKQGILNMNACITYTDKEDPYLTDASPLFHKSQGYSLAGHFHKCGYKFGRWYDMIWMEKWIGTHPCHPLPPAPYSSIPDRNPETIYQLSSKSGN